MKRIPRWPVSLSCVALIFAATASAQIAPTSPFVVSGEAAKRIHDFSMINLATAQRIAEACENFARKQNVGISIYILDNEGNHVYMHRMDGQGYVSIVTAEMKARTAVLTHQPSKARMNRVVQNPDTELQQIQIGLYPNSGGLPIIVNDQMIGAIGVGGSAPRLAEGWSDEICAHTALTEVLGPQPPLIQDLPERAAVNRGNAPVPTFKLPQDVTPKSSLPPEFVVSAALQPRSLTAIRFQAKRPGRSREPAAIGAQREAAPCRFTSSILMAHSSTRNAATACSITTCTRACSKLRPRCKPGNLLRFATLN